jgi:transglutaminase-like putative cysteine protease
MHIQLGYELAYRCTRPTPMILTLSVHYSRVSDLIAPDHMIVTPALPVTQYRDGFGNWCSRIVAPVGTLRLTANAIIDDSGLPDAVSPEAQQLLLQNLPEDTLVFLLPSRYCESDLFADIAWNMFGNTPLGWARVQRICDFVHDYITFGYEFASPTKTAFQVFHERRGVCRDFAHLAIALCRCLNIPARYCTGYLGDIGVPPVDAPMDFSAWFEAYLGDRWHTFDPRNHQPRIGRVLIARGRDAADVAISTSFGESVLEAFRVWTDEIVST